MFNVDTARTDGIGRTYIYNIRTHGHLTGFRSHLGKMTNYTVIIKNSTLTVDTRCGPASKFKLGMQ